MNNSFLVTPPINFTAIVFFVSLALVVAVASFYAGRRAGRKWKGRSLIIVSIVYPAAVWICSLIGFVAPLWITMILSNAALDVGFFKGYSTQRKPS